MAKENDKESFVFRDKRHQNEEGEDNSADDANNELRNSSDNSHSESEQSSDQPRSTTREEKVQSQPAAEAPPIDFSTFVLSMASSAVHHMGGFQDPVSGKTSINLELAKQTIEILEMFEKKSEGNLTTEESKLITHSLYDLRMKYVELSSKEGNN
ncbi:MAG TPA: DUF1844 domain-containing protein [Nitrospinota bacterium]|nr:DUF1844 domain-containing protein [Nitrospinota bacterium]|tara:strand:- start:54624 stop:55088 length:465 start_codon:yes stop_codon:yes gene_type:complete